jgi:hypothetical protein
VIQPALRLNFVLLLSKVFFLLLFLLDGLFGFRFVFVWRALELIS